MAAAVGLAKPLNLSAELEAVVGSGPMPRTQVIKKLWDYIKANGLQNPSKKTEIVPDAKLAAVLGKDPIHMLAMSKVLSKHLS